MTYEEKLLKAKEKAERVKEKQNIDMVAHFYDKPRKKLTFGKLMLLFLIVNCTVIEVFSMVAMWTFGDLSPLGGLIAAICTETVSVCAYFAKSTIENKVGGITHDLAMMDAGGCNGNDDEAVG